MRRGNARRGPERDLAERAQAAADRVVGASAPARGGLAGALVRALRLGRSAPAAAAPPADAADTAELARLREALVRELDRVAQDRPPEHANAPSPGAAAQARTGTRDVQTRG